MMLTSIKIFEHACEVNDFEQFRKINEKSISSFKLLYSMNNASQNLTMLNNLSVHEKNKVKRLSHKKNDKKTYELAKTR